MRKAQDFFKDSASWQSQLIKDNWEEVHVFPDLVEKPRVHSKAGFYYAMRNLTIDEMDKRTRQLTIENQALIINLEASKKNPKAILKDPAREKERIEYVNLRITELLSEINSPPKYEQSPVVCPNTRTFSRIVADELRGQRKFIPDMYSEELVQIAKSMGVSLTEKTA